MKIRNIFSRFEIVQCWLNDEMGCISFSPNQMKVGHNIFIVISFFFLCVSKRVHRSDLKSGVIDIIYIYII